MTFRLFICFVVFAVSLLAIPPLPGDAINGPLAKDSRIRYADLLRLICPDLQVEDDNAVKATATRAIGIREVGTNDTPAEAEGEIVVESVKTVALLKTRPRVLVSFVMNASDNVPEMLYLAMFDLRAMPKLVDVVAVPGFPDDAGDYESSLKVNETTDAYLSASYHSNSSQGYTGYTILFVHGDRLEKIVDVGLLTSHTFGDVQSLRRKRIFQRSLSRDRHTGAFRSRPF